MNQQCKDGEACFWRARSHNERKGGGNEQTNQTVPWGLIDFIAILQSRPLHMLHQATKVQHIYL